MPEKNEMEEEAKVIETNGSISRLEIGENKACQSCHACFKGEGGGMFIMAENSLGAKEGDRVRVEISPRLVLKGSFLIYLMPMIGMILGAFLTSQVTNSEGVKIIGAIGGLVVSFLLIFFYLRKTESPQPFPARIIKIIGQ